MMKKIYRNISILCAIVFVVSASSCKKLLTQEPKNSTYLEVFWKTASDAKSAIAGNYSLLRQAVTDKENRYYMYGDAIAKNYFTMEYNGDGLEGIQNGDFTFQYNLNTLGNYRLYYKSVAMSNVALANIAKMTDEQLKDVDNPTKYRNELMGQAYFLRALAYFMMVRVWGDVPIVTEAYDDPISAPQLPRSPKAEVMKLIEDDCHRAYNLLAWTYENTGDAKVTANRGSVYALLAHLYLWRATMSDVSTDAVNLTDVNSADTTINALRTKGGYTVSVGNSTDATRYTNTFVGRSSEGIFEINMSENTLEGSASSIGTRFLNTSYVDYYSNSPRFWVKPAYLSSNFGADTLDIRFKLGFALRSSDRPLCVKYSNVIYRNPGQKRDAYLSNNMILFRLSDMILLQAEIALYKGDATTARNIINSVRTRNSPNPILVTATSVSGVMDEYIKERNKELFLEGHLFYDLLRTRRFEGFIDWLTISRFRSGGFYFPLDPALFRENINLQQTPYWLGKV